MPHLRSLRICFLSALSALSGAWLLAACHAEPDDPGTPKPGARKPAAQVTTQPQQPPEPCGANEDPLLTAPFTDDFERTGVEPGPDWHTTSYGAYYLNKNRLCTSKPRNHPLWLKRKLPINVRVEFNAVPTVNADIKAELFGDGCAFDTLGKDYTSTGYVGVLGAHNNTENWLTRLYEHGDDAKKNVLKDPGEGVADSKWKANTTYKVELARTDGKEVRLSVNGVLLHALTDPSPLMGAGHDHFAFNGWEAPVCFDKLVITPL